MTGAPVVSRVTARKKWDDEEDEDDVGLPHEFSWHRPNKVFAGYRFLGRCG